MAAQESVDASIDDLFALPLEEFTAARNALAKQVRAGGDRAAADEIKGLRKPPITAWALNQLARRRPQDVEALLDAGAALRRAHERALEGDGSDLRDAGRTQQQRVTDLARQAAAILDEAGSSGDAHIERLTQSLRAASTDEAAGAQLQRGRLTTDLDDAGFGLLDAGLTGALAASVTAPARTRGGPGETDGSPSEQAEADARAERQAAARRRVITARRAAERARHAAGEAAERAARLGEEAERAEELAAAARRRADEATAEARAADRAAGDAEADLDAAEGALSAEA